MLQSRRKHLLCLFGASVGSLFLSKLAWRYRNELQNLVFPKPPQSSPFSRWLDPSEVDLKWPPSNIDSVNFNNYPENAANAGIADLRGLDLKKLKLLDQVKVLEKSEDWEVGDSNILPGYPSVVRNINGRNADGKYYLFYAVHDPPSGIGCAVSENIESPFTKLAKIRTKMSDSRILKAPTRPRGTSHFSSPVVIWNPVNNLWHLYFHFFRNEISTGFGHQKTALATTDDLGRGKWEILSDKEDRYITPMLAHGEWTNSQSSYHAISRLPDGQWLALLRGTSMNNRTTSLGFGISTDGVFWALMPPTPAITTNTEEKVVKPVAVAIINEGNIAYVWSVYNKRRQHSQAYINSVGKLKINSDNIFLNNWSPGDGASSIWRNGSEINIFSANYRYTFG